MNIKQIEVAHAGEYSRVWPRPPTRGVREGEVSHKTHVPSKPAGYRV